MNTQKIKGLYGLLKGIAQSLSFSDYHRSDILEDYNHAVDQLIVELADDLDYLKADPSMGYDTNTGRMVRSQELQPKVLQTISYLEYSFNLGQSILEVGSLYNSILDEELKSRCADLLTAPNNFDRVINQATLVLENRIRIKSHSEKSLKGVALINEIIKPEIEKSTLVLSKDPDEQRGFSEICKGIMSALRNPSHHYIEDISREKALRICGFIDILLGIIDDAEYKPKK